MGDFYTSGHVTSGSYFTYKGVRYGSDTVVLFTEAFYDRMGETAKYFEPQPYYYRTFHDIKNVDGKMKWVFGKNRVYPLFKYDAIDPEKDIRRIVRPVYFIEPKELVKLRLKNGTWINFIGKETLLYVLCLLISPIFQQWYAIWTTGLIWFLLYAYHELSKGALYNEW